MPPCWANTSRWCLCLTLRLKWFSLPNRVSPFNDFVEEQSFRVVRFGQFHCIGDLQHSQTCVNIIPEECVAIRDKGGTKRVIWTWHKLSLGQFSSSQSVNTAGIDSHCFRDSRAYSFYILLCQKVNLLSRGQKEREGNWSDFTALTKPIRSSVSHGTLIIFVWCSLKCKDLPDLLT